MENSALYKAVKRGDAIQPLVILDLVKDEIKRAEALHRPDVQKILLAVPP